MSSLARKTVPAAQYAQIVQEAAAVAEMIKSPGWKVIEEDLLRQAGRIEELLSENRLRTVHETITEGKKTKTLVTTAETQIAENAGMYKQIRQIFTTIETIIEAPNKLSKLEAEGVVAIAKPDPKQPVEELRPTPFKVPAVLDQARKRITDLLSRRRAA